MQNKALVVPVRIKIHGTKEEITTLMQNPFARQQDISAGHSKNNPSDYIDGAGLGKTLKKAIKAVAPVVETASDVAIAAGALTYGSIGSCRDGCGRKNTHWQRKGWFLKKPMKALRYKLTNAPLPK